MTTPTKTTVVLVTGANRGIGKAIVEGLAERNCFVIATVRKEQDVPGADLVLSGFDLEDPVSIQKGLEECAKICDRIDVLINNAAILLEWNESVLDIKNAHMEKIFSTNVVGTHLVTMAALPLLRKSKNARIIHLSSRAGQLSSMGHWSPSYSISKAALNALTLQHAGALANDEIVVNCMSPGWVKTDMGGENAERTPEEGADTAIWLALEADQNLTGKFFADRKIIDW